MTAVTLLSSTSHADLRFGWLHLVSMYKTESFVQAEQTTGSLDSLAAALCTFWLLLLGMFCRLWEEEKENVKLFDYVEMDVQDIKTLTQARGG